MQLNATVAARPGPPLQSRADAALRARLAARRLRPQLPRLHRRCEVRRRSSSEAHALGFRVMPHVNYFGCDPENPLYEQFKQ